MYEVCDFQLQFSPGSLLFYIQRFAKDFNTINTLFFILANSFLQQSNDGAFEVFVNGELVFSKLERGRFPTEEVVLCNSFHLQELLFIIGASGEEKEE